MGDSRRMMQTAEAAKFLGVSVSWLKALRTQGAVGGRRTGPPFSKISYKVTLYDLEDLEAWVRDKRNASGRAGTGCVQ